MKEGNALHSQGTRVRRSARLVDWSATPKRPLPLSLRSAPRSASRETAQHVRNSKRRSSSSASSSGATPTVLKRPRRTTADNTPTPPGHPLLPAMLRLLNEIRQRASREQKQCRKSMSDIDRRVDPSEVKSQDSEFAQLQLYAQVEPWEKVERDEGVLQRARAIERRAASERVKPALPSAPRNKTHWDYLLEEVVNLARERIEDQKWHWQQCKRVSKSVARHFSEAQTRQQRMEREVDASLSRKASQLAREVKKFWRQVEQVAKFKAEQNEEQEKKAERERQLGELLGQTEKYTTLLVEDLKRRQDAVREELLTARMDAVDDQDSDDDRGDESSTTTAPDRAELGKREQRARGTGGQSYATVKGEPAVRYGDHQALEGTASSLSEMQDLTDDDEGEEEMFALKNIDVAGSDDETTLHEEEKLGASSVNIDDRRKEISALNDEADAPIDELLRSQGIDPAAYFADRQMASSDSGSSSDHSALVERREQQHSPQAAAADVSVNDAANDDASTASDAGLPASLDAGDQRDTHQSEGEFQKASSVREQREKFRRELDGLSSEQKASMSRLLSQRGIEAEEYVGYDGEDEDNEDVGEDERRRRRTLKTALFLLSVGNDNTASDELAESGKAVAGAAEEKNADDDDGADDPDFDNVSDANSKDDESTLRLEEENQLQSTDGNDDDELENDLEVPVEELLRRQGIDVEAYMSDQKRYDATASADEPSAAAMSVPLKRKRRRHTTVGKKRDVELPPKGTIDGDEAATSATQAFISDVSSPVARRLQQHRGPRRDYDLLSREETDERAAQDESEENELDFAHNSDSDDADDEETMRLAEEEEERDRRDEGEVDAETAALQGDNDLSIEELLRKQGIDLSEYAADQRRYDGSDSDERDEQAAMAVPPRRKRRRSAIAADDYVRKHTTSSVRFPTAPEDGAARESSPGAMSDEHRPADVALPKHAPITVKREGVIRAPDEPETSAASERHNAEGAGERAEDNRLEKVVARLDQASARPDVDELVMPTLLRGQLRSYQVEGLRWLLTLYENGLNGILADEMGLGKTIMTIALLAWLAELRGVWGPHLVVVPTSVMLNWEVEFKKWCPGLKVLSYFGSVKERRIKRQGWSKNNTFHVCITSYKLVVQDAASFKRKRWKYLILDEAQNIKNFQSQRWQTLLTFATKRRLLLSGTPLQNSIMELWSLLHFLMPEIFTSHTEFKDWFFSPVNSMAANGSTEANALVVRRLHAVLRPFLLRRLKSEVEKGLPPKVEHVIQCPLSKRQRRLYEDFMERRDTRRTLAEGGYIGVMNVLIQLRKVCNHPDLFEGRPILSPMHMTRLVYRVPDAVLLSRGSSSADALRTVDRSLLALEFADLELRGHAGAWLSAQLQQLKASPIMTASLQLLCSVGESGDAGEEGIGAVFGGYPGMCREQKVATLRLAQYRRAVTLREARLTAMRCAAQPLYGAELRDAVQLPANAIESSMAAEARGDWTKFCGHQLALVPTLQLLGERSGILTERFGTCVTAVVAEPVELRVAAGWREERQSLAQLEVLKRGTRAISDAFRSARVRSQVALPDARLVQWDCGKLQVLAELLRDMRAHRHRVLIFTQMTKMLDVLEGFLNLHRYRYLRLDGMTKTEERQKLMERFNTDERIFCFILTTRSGGVGMNLTGADVVLFYDSDWNPQIDAQAQDRAHRIGQTRTVHVYRLVSERTVEENILAKAREKRNLESIVIEQANFNTKGLDRKMHVMELFDGVEGDAAERTSSLSPTSRSVAAQKVTAGGSTEVDPPTPGAADSAEVDDERDVVALQEQALNLEDFGNDDEGPTLEAAAAAAPASSLESIIEQHLKPIERYALRWMSSTAFLWHRKLVQEAAHLSTQVDEELTSG